MPPTDRSRTGARPGCWVPGQSGNPLGRPKGFAAAIKALCGGDDYPKIALGFALIAWGSKTARRKFFGAELEVTTADRLRALTELRDSGPGKPAQPVEIAAEWQPLFVLAPGDDVVLTLPPAEEDTVQ